MRFKQIFSIKNHNIKVKIDTSDWMTSTNDLILVLSIDTKFNSDANAESYLEAIFKTMDLSKGFITVFISDCSHLNAYSLINNVSIVEASELQHSKALMLKDKYSTILSNRKILFWKDLVDDSADEQIKKLILDDVFQEKLVLDAKDITTKRNIQQSLFEAHVEATKLDLIEHCRFCFVAYNKGYRYEFYVGKQYASVTYAMDLFSKNLSRVNIYVKVET
jgi:hypothetical protein